MALNYFGTSIAILAAEVFGITLSADSTPTADNAEGAYKRRVQDVNGFVRSLRVDPSSIVDEDGETFGVCALICEHEGKAYLYQAVRPDTEGREQAEFHLDQASRKRDELRKRVSELGDDAPTDVGRIMSSAGTTRRNTRARRAQMEADRLTRWLGDTKRP